MCLTIPKQVVSVSERVISVKAGRQRETVGSLLAVKKGDWVLTQNSVIIRKITAQQAKEVKQLLK